LKLQRLNFGHKKAEAGKRSRSWSPAARNGEEIQLFFLLFISFPLSWCGSAR
jgi:hypothetical protein